MLLAQITLVSTEPEIKIGFGNFWSEYALTIFLLNNYKKNSKHIGQT